MINWQVIGQLIANITERDIMWALQFIIIITKVLALIFGSIQSSVRRAPTFGSTQQA